MNIYMNILYIIYIDNTSIIIFRTWELLVVGCWLNVCLLRGQTSGKIQSRQILIDSDSVVFH